MSKPNLIKRKSFRDTQEATFRRVQRDKVRKSNLTRTEKEIALSFLNHWFVHRHKGAVHPGRKRLVKQSKASMRTVNRTLAILRSFGVIRPVAFDKGNCRDGFGKATEYDCDVQRLGVFADVPKGALVEWRKCYEKRNNGVPKKPTSGGANLAPRNKPCNVILFPGPRK